MLNPDFLSWQKFVLPSVTYNRVVLDHKSIKNYCSITIKSVLLGEIPQFREMTIKKTVSIGPAKMKLLSDSLSEKRLLVFHGEIAYLDG